MSNFNALKILLIKNIWPGVKELIHFFCFFSFIFFIPCAVGIIVSLFLEPALSAFIGLGTFFCQIVILVIVVIITEELDNIKNRYSRGIIDIRGNKI